MSKKRVVVSTCLDKDKNNDYKKVWDEIIKEKIEEKYGKIKNK